MLFRESSFFPIARAEGREMLIEIALLFLVLVLGICTFVSIYASFRSLYASPTWIYAFPLICAPSTRIYAFIRRLPASPFRYMHPHCGRPPPRPYLYTLLHPPHPPFIIPPPTISMSTDPESRTNFGPFLSHVGPTYVDRSSSSSFAQKADEVKTIRYGVIEDMERALELDGEEVAAVLIEPIQGEAG